MTNTTWNQYGSGFDVTSAIGHISKIYAGWNGFAYSTQYSTIGTGISVYDTIPDSTATAEMYIGLTWFDGPPSDGFPMGTTHQDEKGLAFGYKCEENLGVIKVVDQGSESTLSGYTWTTSDEFSVDLTATTAKLKKNGSPIHSFSSPDTTKTYHAYATSSTDDASSSSQVDFTETPVDTSTTVIPPPPAYVRL